MLDVWVVISSRSFSPILDGKQAPLFEQVLSGQRCRAIVYRRINSYEPMEYGGLRRTMDVQTLYYLDRPAFHIALEQFVSQVPAPPGFPFTHSSFSSPKAQTTFHTFPNLP